MQVTEELSGKPLDAVVRALFSLSWGKARACIETGKVQLDGQTVTSSTRRVRAGCDVALRMSAPRPRPSDLACDRVIFLDTHVVVINKPAGISTIPYGDVEQEDTLDAKVRAHLAKTVKSERGARPALGIVHRLDKETSGLIVFTRTWLAKKSLTEQFRAHTVGRRYLAIVHGNVRASQTIRSQLVVDRGDGLRGSVQRTGQREKGGAAPQLAITHIDVIEHFALQSGAAATLVACRLETGRTHQIRIHLSEAGHPLVGERVYIRGFSGEIIPAPRLMLHAAELGFVHPASQKPVAYTLPLPPDMEETLGRLRA